MSDHRPLILERLRSVIFAVGFWSCVGVLVAIACRVGEEDTEHLTYTMMHVISLVMMLVVIHPVEIMTVCEGFYVLTAEFFFVVSVIARHDNSEWGVNDVWIATLECAVVLLGLTCHIIDIFEGPFVQRNP